MKMKKWPVPVYELLDLKQQPPVCRSWAEAYSSVEYASFIFIFLDVAQW